MPIREHDVVRVIALNTLEREYSGSSGIARAPRIGDVGTVIIAPRNGKPAGWFHIEMCREDGHSVWMADFHESELELVR